MAVRAVSAVVDTASHSRPPARIDLAPRAAIRGAVRAMARGLATVPLASSAAATVPSCSAAIRVARTVYQSEDAAAKERPAIPALAARTGGGARRAQAR